MSLLEVIEAKFGKEVAGYVQNKHRGGTNNAKGNTFESFFALFQIAQFSCLLLEDECEAVFSSQNPSFVDDLVIHVPSSSEISSYQIKDVKSLTWGYGIGSLVDDFTKQNILDGELGFKISKCFMVVSRTEVIESLKATMPETLESFTQLLLFPSSRSVSQLLVNFPDLKTCLTKISAFETEPAPDKLETIAAALLGAWVACEQVEVPLARLLDAARQCTPSYIRPSSIEVSLDPAVKQILDNIPKFTYELTKGFLKWSYNNGLFEGTLSYSTSDARFAHFQDYVKRSKPTSFIDLEGSLI